MGELRQRNEMALVWDYEHPSAHEGHGFPGENSSVPKLVELPHKTGQDFSILPSMVQAGMDVTLAVAVEPVHGAM